jgi:N-acetylglucosaminyl-diphospho-decaprenol L-rhamnosyltransferase
VTTTKARRVDENGSETPGATRVAVVVVSWNTRNLLRRCLESFASEADRGLVEVWVIDNASTDGSPELVRDHFGWAHLIAPAENLGFGRAVNLAVRRSSAEWIAVANADVAVRPTALAALLEAGARDPAAGAIAPRLLLPDGSTQHSVFGFPTVPFAFLLATGAYRLWPGLADRLAMMGHWDTERARRVPWAVAAFLLVRRAAWDEVGGFDERQWMYAEDLDLGWRLREAGWATRYEPRAVVDHENSASTSQMFGPDVAPQWQRSTYGCLARRRGIVRTWAVALLNFAGAGGRWAAYGLVATVRPEYAGRRDAWGRWAPVHLRVLRGRRALERLR